MRAAIPVLVPVVATLREFHLGRPHISIAQLLPRIAPLLDRHVLHALDGVSDRRNLEYAIVQAAGGKIEMP